MAEQILYGLHSDISGHLRQRYHPPTIDYYILTNYSRIEELVRETLDVLNSI